MNHDLIEGATGAADFTGLSRRKIYRMTEQGLLPVTRKGGRLYYRKSQLDDAFTASAGSWAMAMACLTFDDDGALPRLFDRSTTTVATLP